MAYKIRDKSFKKNLATSRTETNTFSGVQTFSGNNVHSGSNTFTGATQTFNSALTVTDTITQSKSITAANLGTARSVHGQMTANFAGTVTAGSVAGVRGVTTVASGTTIGGGVYLYGAQGKLVVAGVMGHEDSRLCAGLSQLDGTGGTFTTGQLSGHWVDVTGVSGAGGGQFNLLRLTCDNAAHDAKPNAVIYAQSNASYLFDLGHPSGTTTDYLVAAGTGAGSAGKSDGCAAQKVLTIVVDGTAYFIPAFNQNT